MEIKKENLARPLCKYVKLLREPADIPVPSIHEYTHADKMAVRLPGWIFFFSYMMMRE